MHTRGTETRNDLTTERERERKNYVAVFADDNTGTANEIGRRLRYRANAQEYDLLFHTGGQEVRHLRQRIRNVIALHVHMRARSLF